MGEQRLIIRIVESYIQISKINDYLFCPRSVYLHSVYEGFDKKTYHSHYQTAGTLAHKTIEEDHYSSLARYMVGIPVYSDQYWLAGKIDIYDKKEKILIERKKRLKQLFDGQCYQLYAQMLCMREMGYPVDRLVIHSLDDNKRHGIALPSKTELQKFLGVLVEMQKLDNPVYGLLQTNVRKCANCIYQPLCRGDVC